MKCENTREVCRRHARPSVNWVSVRWRRHRCLIQEKTERGEAAVRQDAVR